MVESNVLIIGGIISIFLILGVTMPFINAEFDNDDLGNENINSIAEDMEVSSPIGLFSVLASVAKMFFFTFGQVPFWIDITILMLLRMVLVLAIVDMAWIG